MEATGNNRLYWDNGKENGSYYNNRLYWDNGKKMEATITMVYIGIM